MKHLGQLLHVDLTSAQCARRPLPEALIRGFMGGRGFNAAYLLQHLEKDADPLGPENILLLSAGLLGGSSAPAASRLHINALSPQTNILGSSNIGGYAAAWLRSCGLLSVAIHGWASQPVYLLIREDRAELRPAGFLWGLDSFDTQDRLKDELNDDRIRVLAIGPGGENGALFACITSGRDHAAGRTGMGAVMGAKNLKAIVVVRGIWQPFQDRADVGRNAAREYIKHIKKARDFRKFSEYGSAGYVRWANDLGIVGTRNYRQTRFEDGDRIDAQHLADHVTRKSGCFRCPVQCKADLKWKTGQYEGARATRPEFESMLNLGAKCGLNDIESIVHLDNLCSRLGLDITSAASTIAFAMDLFDRGILTREDCGGLDLSWGNAETMETLIRQIAYGEGFGCILARGVRRAAWDIGKGAEGFAAHVKGLELTAYHPGAIMGTALGYAVSSRGGDYNNISAALEYGWSPEQAARSFGTPQAVNIHRIEGKGPLVRRAVLVNAVLDSLGLCKVPALSLLGAFDLEQEAALTAAVTGLDIRAVDLFTAGERIATAERLFNLGQSPASPGDGLPPMFLKDPDGRLTPENLEEMLQAYYRAMGWDAEGRPRAAKLEALGLADRMPLDDLDTITDPRKGCHS